MQVFKPQLGPGELRDHAEHAGVHRPHLEAPLGVIRERVDQAAARQHSPKGQADRRRQDRSDGPAQGGFRGERSDERRSRRDRREDLDQHPDAQDHASDQWPAEHQSAAPPNVSSVG